MTECEAFALRHVSFVYETAGINAHGETDAANRLETDANRTAVAKNTARAAVDDVSLTIKRGEWVTIIGSNGSGKTTLSRMLAAVSAPTSGQINVLGEHLYDEERGAQRSVYVRA
nr:ATP-binding cassette domain-containing protein [Alloscardovia omnicolens]